LADIRGVFGDYHIALRRLASSLGRDEELAEACIVDACTIETLRNRLSMNGSYTGPHWRHCAVLSIESNGKSRNLLSSTSEVNQFSTFATDALAGTSNVAA
jgi:hypothetical protein